MMGYILGGMLLLGMVSGLMTGRMDQVSAAAMTGCGDAIELIISLTGTLCLWSGIMRIAEKSGITAGIGSMMRPVTRMLFRHVPQGSRAMQAICMNLAANLLGLGNAATPLGLAAMRELDRDANYPATATSAMITFVVLNTASVQLLPTTNAFLRLEAGSRAPMEILPAVWASSAASVAVGVFLSWALGRRRGNGQKHQ